jgi:hypothetical protein
MIVVAVYSRDRLHDDVATSMVTLIFGMFCLPPPQTLLSIIRSDLTVSWVFGAYSSHSIQQELNCVAIIQTP